MTRVIGCLLLFLFAPCPVYSCTSTRLTIEGLPTDVIGRTMELGGATGLLPSLYSEPIDTNLPWKIGVHPIGEKLGLIDNFVCVNSHHWKNKVSFLSVDLGVSIKIEGQMLDFTTATEGMNTAGLTVSGQTNRLALYPKSAGKSTPGILNICFIDVVNWILGNFESVHDLRETLSQDDVRIVNSVLPFVRDPENRLHWAIDDAYGDHIVVEYVGKKIQILDNKVGILTNDPFYEWHLRNLNNYVNLSPFWADAGGSSIQIDTDIGNVPVAIGHGSNLLGIPGDYTPASRFVKQFYLRQFAVFNLKPVTVNNAIVLMTALLNTVFIPKGVLANEKMTNKGYEFTAYTVLKLPQHKVFYYKDYMNNQWRMIDLKRLNITKNFEQPLEDKTMGIKDVTEKFNSDNTSSLSKPCVDTGYNCIPVVPVIPPENLLFTFLFPLIVGIVLGACIVMIKGRRSDYNRAPSAKKHL